MSTITANHEIGSITLPPPQWERAHPLLQMLANRRSAREFSPRPLPPEVLSTLLWAACGVNRPKSGGRTAPSAHNWQEIEIFAALADGTYRYDPAGHALHLARRPATCERKPACRTSSAPRRSTSSTSPISAR
jgi:nitroreductase